MKQKLEKKLIKQLETGKETHKKMKHLDLGS